MQAWEIYFEEFQRRGGAADAHRFARAEPLAEAAHDAYRAAADRLTGEYGWTDERTLIVMRGLNDAARRWLTTGSTNWDELRAELQRRERQLTAGYGDRDDRLGEQR